MVRARVKLISSGMADLLHDPGVTAELVRRAERVAAQARSVAPVVSGAYRDSIRVETVEHQSRVVARVVADVPYAMVVESSTGTLAKSLDAAGGA